MKKKLPAFTLLESLLTLFIFSLIVMVPAMDLNRVQHRQTTQLFEQRFRQELALTQQNSFLYHSAGRVKVREVSNTIDFLTNGLSGPQTITLAVPDGWQVTKRADIKLLPEKSVSPATITFKDSKSQMTYHYAIQLGAGKLICHAEKS